MKNIIKKYIGIVKKHERVRSLEINNIPGTEFLKVLNRQGILPSENERNKIANMLEIKIPHQDTSVMDIIEGRVVPLRKTKDYGYNEEIKRLEQKYELEGVFTNIPMPRDNTYITKPMGS